VCALAAIAVFGVAPTVSAAPADLVDLLKRNLGFSDDDIADAHDGPVVRELEGGAGATELFVAGMARIGASPDAIAEELRRSGGLVDREGLKQAGVFHVPPVAADVADFRIPASDVEVLADCELGDCKFKLQADRLRELQQLDWSASDIDEQVRKVARKAMLEYVSNYVQKGHSTLAVYADKQQRASAQKGFQKIIETASYVQQSMPEVDRYFEEYPNASVAESTDFIRWSVQDYGYRPVTAVVHTLVLEPEKISAGEPAVTIVQKYLFATHYFTARIEMIGLFPEDTPGTGTYLVYVDRSLFDGELGGLKRRMLVSGVLNNVEKRLDAVRDHFAAGR
jgi:hypothetical protein